MPAKDNLPGYPRPRPAGYPSGQGPGPCTRLILGGHFADIVSAGHGVAPAYHWVVQRAGSAEILRLGRERTLGRALERAHEYLEQLARRNNGGKKQRAVFYEFGELKKPL
jgi:hypothetical protein